MNLSKAAKIVGVNQGTLSRWIIAGMVQPPGWAGVRGAQVQIGPKELREFLVIRDLKRAGVTGRAIRKAAATLQAAGANPFSKGRFLAVDRGRELVRLVGETEGMALLKQQGQMLLTLPEEPATD